MNLGARAPLWEVKGCPALSTGGPEGAWCADPRLLTSSRSTLCTAGRAPASRRHRRSLRRGSSPTRQCALRPPMLPRERPPMPSGHRSGRGPGCSSRVGSFQGRGNPRCTFTGSLCVCISCQRLLHPSLEVLVPELSAAPPLSSRTEAVLVCTGPLPSVGWGRSGMGGAGTEPSACHRPPIQHLLLGSRSLLQTCDGPAHLPRALLLPHLVMPEGSQGLAFLCLPFSVRAGGLPENHPPLPQGALLGGGAGSGPRVLSWEAALLPSLSLSPSCPCLQAQACERSWGRHCWCLCCCWGFLPSACVPGPSLAAVPELGWASRRAVLVPAG